MRREARPSGRQRRRVPSLGARVAWLGASAAAVAVAVLAGCGAYISSLMWDVPFRIRGHYEAFLSGGVYRGDHFSLRPDGRYVAYSSPRTGHGDIYLAACSGGSARRLTATSDFEGDPCFSPDGAKIAYVRETAKCGHIWVMDADGTAQRQLTWGDSYDDDPRYSADGSSIWFVRTPRGTRSGEEREVSIHGGPTRSVAGDYGGRLMEPSFCPADTQAVVYWKPPGEVVRASPGATPATLGDGAMPGLSSDCRLVASVTGPYARSLSVSDADGASRRVLYAASGPIDWPQFSPGGRWIYFIMEGCDGEIRRIPAQGGAVQPVAKTLK